MEISYQAQLALGNTESPLPMIQTKEVLDLLSQGEVVKISVERESAVSNIKTLIANNPYELIKLSKEQNQYVLFVKKL